MYIQADLQRVSQCDVVFGIAYGLIGNAMVAFSYMDLKKGKGTVS